MVVIARLNTLPPNAASTAETLLLCRSGKRMVRILRKKPAPAITLPYIPCKIHVAEWGENVFRSGLDEFSYNFGKMAGCR